MAKIKSLSGNEIVFDDGSRLYSDHDQDCCESHSLDVDGISLSEVEDLEFDLDQPLEDLIEKVEDYGIRLKSSNNFPVSIPGYGYNNGYYSSNLTLKLQTSKKSETIDISDCQKINWD